MSSGVAASEGQRRTGAEIKALVYGNVMAFETDDWKTGSVGYAQDGSTDAKLDSDGGDTGKWVIKDNSLCMSWSKWRVGKEHCVKYTKLGDGKLRYEPVSGSGDGGTALKKWNSHLSYRREACHAGWPKAQDSAGDYRCADYHGSIIKIRL